MVYAQIKLGMIMNVIVLDDPTIAGDFLTDPASNMIYDEVIRIDDLSPQPCISWLYENKRFTAPDGW